MNRRDFAKTLAAAFPAFAPAAAQSGERYWEMVKRQYPLKDGLIYLNAANVAPASRPVLARYQEMLADFQGDPSFQNREKFEAIHQRLRVKLGKLLGVTGEEIAITRNTSEASNLIVQGLDLKAGDEIVALDQNHPSNLSSWQIRARRHGLKVRVVKVPQPAGSRDELIGLIEKQMTPQTRVVAITHQTNTTGQLFPVKEIAERAHAKGAWLHLDGAQSFGALNVNLRALGVDSYSGSAHKWLMGPLECGALYVRSERIKEVWPSVVTAGWSDSLQGAAKFEVFGQRDDARIVAFETAVDFLDAIGMDVVEQRVRMLTSTLRTKLLALPGVTLVGNGEPDLTHSVVKVRPPKNTAQLYDRLYREHRIATSGTPSGPLEGIRFSPHIYNTLDEIKTTVEAFQKASAA
jgi:isopenicillin-N epimerase